MIPMSEPVAPRLAATLILARDSDEGLQLFMVARHRQIEFASGALVFPGGSVEPDDADQRLHQRAEGGDTADPAMFLILVAAAREAVVDRKWTSTKSRHKCASRMTS